MCTHVVYPFTASICMHVTYPFATSTSTHVAFIVVSYCCDNILLGTVILPPHGYRGSWSTSEESVRTYKISYICGFGINPLTHTHNTIASMHTCVDEIDPGQCMCVWKQQLCVWVGQSHSHRLWYFTSPNGLSWCRSGTSIATRWKYYNAQS